ALRDLTDARLRAMDDAGVDMQVLSLVDPNPQELPTRDSVTLIRRANDRLAETCAAHSNRFAGFAALPTQVPEEAALELERCIKILQLKGTMARPLTNGFFLDHKCFWPIFEMAERLGVPLYLHPATPHPTVTESTTGITRATFLRSSAPAGVLQSRR